jgi:TRAP-type C4-dicarboxylate transport system permease small subunit
MDRVGDFVATIAARLAGVLVALVVAVVIVGMVDRNIPFVSLVSSIELTETAFPWVVFLGAAAAFQHRREIVVEIIMMALPRRWQLLVLAASFAITAGVCGWLGVVGLFFTIQLAGQKTMLLGISIAWRTAAFPVGMALIALVSVNHLFALWRDPDSALKPASHLGGEE